MPRLRPVRTLPSRISRRWTRLRKSVTSVGVSGSAKTVFIVGCQRSGTTLLSRIFDRDPNSTVYNERSSLTSNDLPRGLRLNPFPDVANQLSVNQRGLVVLKPLVESHRVRDLLDYFENSKAIWVYRNYWSVATSIVDRWGPGHPLSDLVPVVEDRLGDWRSDGLSASSRAAVSKHFSIDLGGLDASALFWYSRNRLFFDLKIDDDERVLLCKYEDLVLDPLAQMKRIYGFLDAPIPSAGIVKGVHVSSLKADQPAGISAHIRLICEELLDALNQAKRSRE